MGPAPLKSCFITFWLMGAIQHKEIRNNWGKHNNIFWKDISQLPEKNRDGTRTVYLKTWFLDHQHHLGTCLKCKFLGLTCPTELGILGVRPWNLFCFDSPPPAPVILIHKKGLNMRSSPQKRVAREETLKGQRPEGNDLRRVNDQKWPQKVLIRCLTPILQHASVSKPEIKGQTIRSFQG